MKKKIILSVLAVFAFILIATSIEKVPEDKYAVISTLGSVSIRDYAGPLFKIPFIQSVVYLPKNEMAYDVAPSLATTADKKSLNTDSYCIWRIKDPDVYWKQLGGDISRGERRIDAVIYNAINNRIGQLTQDAIFAGRSGAMPKDAAETLSAEELRLLEIETSLDAYIKANITDPLLYYGIEITDARLKQIVPPQENMQAIFDRMISERNQISIQLTAEGNEDAKKLRNDADKQAQIIIEGAQADAARLEAEGEREYMRILSVAYGTEDRAEFYEFVRAMDALKVATQGNQKSIVLPLDSPLAKWFIEK